MSKARGRVVSGPGPSLYLSARSITDGFQTVLPMDRAQLAAQPRVTRPRHGPSRGTSPDPHISMGLNAARSDAPPGASEGVPSMFDSLEVKVLYQPDGGEG